MQRGMETALQQHKSETQATEIEQQQLIINLQQAKTTTTDKSISSKVNIAKPANLKGAEDWPEFKHAADTYLAFLDKNYSNDIKMAVQQVTLVELFDMDDSTETRAISLYAMLSSWLAHSAESRVLVKSVKDKNGYALWQKLVHHYEPKTLSKGLVWRRQLLNPVFPKAEADFQAALQDWESALAEYIEETGREFEDEDKRGVLLEMAPQNIKQNIQENIGSLGTYELMKDKIENYLSSKKLWKSGRVNNAYGAANVHSKKSDSDAMQVDAFGKSKGKGKGKGKNKSKPPAAGKGAPEKDEKQCDICWHRHLPTPCWFADGKAKGKGKGDKGKAKAKGKGKGDKDKGKVNAVQDATYTEVQWTAWTTAEHQRLTTEALQQQQQHQLTLLPPSSASTYAPSSVMSISLMPSAKPMFDQHTGRRLNVIKSSKGEPRDLQRTAEVPQCSSKTTQAPRISTNHGYIMAIRSAPAATPRLAASMHMNSSDYLESLDGLSCSESDDEELEPMGGILDPEIGDDTECGILLNSRVCANPEIGDTERGNLLNSRICASIDQNAQELFAAELALFAAELDAIHYSLDAYDNDPEIATEIVDPDAANNSAIYYSLDACDNVVTMETFQVPIDRSYTRELYAETDSMQLAAVKVEEQVTQVIASAAHAAFRCERAPPVAKQGLESREGRHAQNQEQSNSHSSHSRFLILLVFMLCGIGWLVLSCPRAQQQGILAGDHSRSSATGSARTHESEEAQHPAEEPAGAAGSSIPSALHQPITPAQEKIDLHNIHHLDVPPRCTSCVKSKAREYAHYRLTPEAEASEMPMVQLDYLFFSRDGKLVELEVQLVTCLSGINTQTSWPLFCMIPHKGKRIDDVFAVKALEHYCKTHCNWILRVTSQFDLEAAEDNNAVQTAQFRTWMSSLQTRYPSNDLEENAHDSHLPNHTTITAYRIVHDKDYTSPMVQYGECSVLCQDNTKVADSASQSKVKAIRLERLDSDNSNALLTKEGFQQARSVRRLPADSQNAKTVLEKVRSLPWTPREGVRLQKAVTKPAHVVFEPAATAPGNPTAEDDQVSPTPVEEIDQTHQPQSERPAEATAGAAPDQKCPAEEPEGTAEIDADSSDSSSSSSESPKSMQFESQPARYPPASLFRGAGATSSCEDGFPPVPAFPAGLRGEELTSRDFGSPPSKTVRSDLPSASTAAHWNKTRINMIIKAASDAIVPGLASSEVRDPQGTLTVKATIVDTLDTVLELSKMHENRLKQNSTLMSKPAFRSFHNLHRSRLTCSDEKISYTKEQNDVMPNTAFDLYLGAQRKPRSAAASQELSLRAQQHNTQGKPVYLYLPKEWYLTDWLADQSDESKAYFREARDGDIVFRLDVNLYGRLTACAVYRNFLTEGLRHARIQSARTYRCKNSHVHLLHYFDDFRSIGKAVTLKATFNTELIEWLDLEMGDLAWPGTRNSVPLGRDQSRTKEIIATVPDCVRKNNILYLLGLDDAMANLASLSSKPCSTTEHQNPHVAPYDEIHRGATGNATCYSLATASDSDSRPAASHFGSSTAGAATANVSPAASHLGSSAAGATSKDIADSTVGFTSNGFTISKKLVIGNKLNMQQYHMYVQEAVHQNLLKKVKKVTNPANFLTSHHGSPGALVGATSSLAMVSLDSMLLAKHIAGAKRLTVAEFTDEPMTTGNDKPESARGGSPAAQPHFTDQIVLILMILDATQVIQTLWYIYAQTYVWYRSSETRPAASHFGSSTAGAATANGSPAASPFGSSTARAANKDIVVHSTNCPSTTDSTYTYEIRMYSHCIARQKKRAKNRQVSTCTSMLLTTAAFKSMQKEKIG